MHESHEGDREAEARLEEAYHTLAEAFEEHLSLAAGSLRAYRLELVAGGPADGTLLVEVSVEMPGSNRVESIRWTVRADEILASEPAAVARRFRREALARPRDPGHRCGHPLIVAVVASSAPPPPRNPREN